MSCIDCGSDYFDGQNWLFVFGKFPPLQFIACILIRSSHITRIDANEYSLGNLIQEYYYIQRNLAWDTLRSLRPHLSYEVL